MWVCACVEHCQSIYTAGLWTDLKIENVSPAEAFYQWLYLHQPPFFFFFFFDTEAQLARHHILILILMAATQRVRSSYKLLMFDKPVINDPCSSLNKLPQVKSFNSKL